MKVKLERPDTYPNCDIEISDLYKIAAALKIKPIPKEGSFVYILKCADKNHWYVGSTTKAYRRFYKHKDGRGANFTAAHGVDKVWYRFPTEDYKKALLLEKCLYNVLTQVYPDFCISMGRPCSCS